MCSLLDLLIILIFITAIPTVTADRALAKSPPFTYVDMRLYAPLLLELNGRFVSLSTSDSESASHRPTKLTCRVHWRT